MRRRDPYAISFVAMAAWAVVVGIVILGFLRDSQGEAATDVGADELGPVSVRGGPQLDVDPIVVIIEPGTGAEAIVAQLVARGVLADAARFEALLDYSGVGPQLKAGRYEFAPRSPASEVIRRLRLGQTDERFFTVVEGTRIEEIGTKMVIQGIATPDEWEAVLALSRREPLLADRPEGASLQGYLFPASYPLRNETTAASLVDAMIAALGEALGPELRADLAASELTLHEVLTLAAIVEREAVLREERPIVASVFLNRLAEGIKLDADPTVQFAITEGAEGEPADGWWKIELTLDDLAFESPYNTYLTAGLPPGPIANPGIEAIRAVLRPAETEYFYFVATGDGSHAFAETLEEHQENVERYLGR